MADKNTSKTTTEQLTDPGFLQELWQQVKLVYYLLRDSGVPLYLKVLPFAGLLYVLFPIDFIPDVIPVLGQLDDLTILIVGLKLFIEAAPADAVAHYMNLMRGQKAVVDGQSSNVNDEAQSLNDTVIIDQPVVDEAKSRKTK